MKRAIFAGCLAVTLLLTAGMALLTPAGARPALPVPQETAVAAVLAPTPAMAPAAETEAAGEPAGFDENYMVRMESSGEIVELPLDVYLTGVVLGEMPPSFEPAALEAQTVAARTFTLRQRSTPKHADADVCGDGRCCQQYLPPEQVREKLGGGAAACEEKVAAAVAGTDGLVAVYNGALIDAVYFSASGGSTEAAAAVWGGEVPYLRPVESPGETDRYEGDTVRVDLETFCAVVQAQAPEARLEGQPAGWFGAVTETAGGGVDQMEIGGAVLAGTELRRLFGLRSTRFTVAVEDHAIVFTTCGYGHRVGMSQYGAQAMAQAGADFRAILTHYYTGVQIVQAEELE